MIRVVVDVNVAVSAILFTNSTPRQAIDLALRRGTILISDAVAQELAQVLARERFDQYVPLANREESRDEIVRQSELVEITESIQVCRDPDDDKILELAISGGAAYIVTGDADLLSLNPFRGIAVVTPAEFLTLFA